MVSTTSRRQLERQAEGQYEAILNDVGYKNLSGTCQSWQSAQVWNGTYALASNVTVDCGSSILAVFVLENTPKLVDAVLIDGGALEAHKIRRAFAVLGVGTGLPQTLTDAFEHEDLVKVFERVEVEEPAHLLHILHVYVVNLGDRDRQHCHGR